MNNTMREKGQTVWSKQDIMSAAIDDGPASSHFYRVTKLTLLMESTFTNK